MNRFFSGSGNCELSNVVGVILAGGLGTRLRTVVVDRPKVLAEVAGRPFLSYLLDQMVSAGIRDVILCTGYLADQVRNTFGSTYGSLTIHYSEEDRQLGTAGALRHALKQLESINTTNRTDCTTLFVMNGDSYCDVDLTEFYAAHLAERAKASLCLTLADDCSRFGRVNLDKSGRVRSFEEKGSSHGQGLINAGIYLLDTEWLYPIPDQTAVSLEREVFPTWIGREFYGFGSQGVSFIDIGTPESFERAQALFAAPS